MRLSKFCREKEKELAEKTGNQQPLRQVENERDVMFLEAKGKIYLKEGVMINGVKGCR